MAPKVSQKKTVSQKLEQFNWAIFWKTPTQDFPGASYGITMKALEQIWVTIN